MFDYLSGIDPYTLLSIGFVGGALTAFFSMGLATWLGNTFNYGEVKNFAAAVKRNPPPITVGDTEANEQFIRTMRNVDPKCHIVFKNMTIEISSTSVWDLDVWRMAAYHWVPIGMLLKVNGEVVPLGRDL